MENLNFLKNFNSGISTLNIIKYNKCVNLSVEEIFDKKMYDHFIGVKIKATKLPCSLGTIK